MSNIFSCCPWALRRIELRVAGRSNAGTATDLHRCIMLPVNLRSRVWSCLTCVNSNVASNTFAFFSHQRGFSNQTYDPRGKMAAFTFYSWFDCSLWHMHVWRQWEMATAEQRSGQSVQTPHALFYLSFCWQKTLSSSARPTLESPFLLLFKSISSTQSWQPDQSCV